MNNIVIVGAGQAGFSIVARLRKQGFEGSISLIGEEDHPPYQRPPLSKAYMLGEMTRDRLLFRQEKYYVEQNINLMTSAAATKIDRQAQKLNLSNGTALDYDFLALTTGSSPKRLPASIGGNLAGVYYVRSLNDADAMADEFKTGRKTVIIGGGYIGLEAAAVAAKNGVNVTLIEAAPRILQRVACEETSDYFRKLHQEHGVKILENTALSALIEKDGRVAGARLADGSVLDCDFALVGIGITPRAELAEAAGLQIDNGITVNEYCQTSDPLIYAAGDCASFPYHGSQIRLESVGNAMEQGEACANHMLGSDTAYQAKPWFWSDQYDIKLQIAGLNTGYNQIVTRPTDERSMAFWYFKDDQLLAVDAMNDPRSYMVGKRLIEAGIHPDKAFLADPGSDLKSLVKKSRS